jgi:ketopantoate reductase
VRIAVLGIGGIGGYLGGRLANRFTPGSEHEILFVEKNRTHLDAIRASGLQLLAKDGDATVRPSLATDSAADLGTVDVALFCTKGYDLVEAGRMMRVAVDDHTVVIPPGNGIGNADLYARASGRATYSVPASTSRRTSRQPASSSRSPAPGSSSSGTPTESLSPIDPSRTCSKLPA